MLVLLDPLGEIDGWGQHFGERRSVASDGSERVWCFGLAIGLRTD